LLTVNTIKSIITPLVEDHPIRRVILFGSYARGDETENSDVDLIIDSEGQLDGFVFFELSGKIIKKMPVKTDIFEISEVKVPSSLFDSIKQEGVIIYET